MIGDFFVMLNHPNKDVGYLPLTDDDDEMMKFETEADAHRAAQSSMLGDAFGYEVFERGCGV